MLSLSIKISDLAIYDIIYISKLVFSDWFVLCISVCGFIETLGQPNITRVDKYMYVDSNFGNILRIECQDNHASYKAIGNYTDKSSWKC